MTIAVFATALAIYVLVGVLVARRVRNTDDFFVMGERASTIWVVGTLAATYLSAVTLLGVAGLAYAEGPLVLTVTGSFGAWVGTVLAVVYVGRKLKALGCRTLPDFFRNRFRSRAVTTVATLIMIVGLLGYGAIQLIGAGLVLGEVTGIPYPLIIVLFVIALMVFSALGGMYGVVVTDTLMFFTMLAVAVVIAPWLISAAGFDAMKSLGDALPGYWTVAGTNSRPLTFTISQFLIWAVFMTCTPAMVSRVFPARDDLVVLKAAGIGAFLASFMQIPVFLAASAMRVLEPGIEPADRVMIVAFLEHVPPFLGGVGLAALMAAIMSTASTLFVLAGFGLSHDLYENLRREGLSERHRMIVSRVGQLVIGLIVTVIAIARPAAIYWISIYAAALFGVGWLPTVVAGLEWRRMNHKAALASMCTGVVTFVGLSEFVRLDLVALPGYLDPMMVALLAAVVSLVIVTLATEPSPEEAAYAQQIAGSSPAAATIAAILAREGGLELLKKRVRRVQWVMGTLVALAVAIYGYLTIELAF